MSYGFVWNSASYGYVNVAPTGIHWYSNATLNVDMWITTTAFNTSVASPGARHSDA